MKALGTTSIQITVGDKRITDTCNDCKLTFNHIQTTLELGLKCPPIGMTVHRPSGNHDYFGGTDLMLAQVDAWDFQKSFGENGICAIYLHYYTYTDVFEPAEKRWNHIHGYVPATEPT